MWMGDPFYGFPNDVEMLEAFDNLFGHSKLSDSHIHMFSEAGVSKCRLSHLMHASSS